MNTIKFKFLDEDIECKLMVTEYENNGSLAIMLMNKDEDGDYEVDGERYDMWCDLTTNLPFFGDHGTCAFVNLKGNTDLVKIIKKYKLAKDLDHSVSSGYNVYGLFEFNMDEVNKYKLEMR